MVPDTPPLFLTRLTGAGHPPPPAGGEPVHLARSYRRILLAELPFMTEPKELNEVERAEFDGMNGFDPGPGPGPKGRAR